MRASSNTMPKKERLPSPGEAGTKPLKISLPSSSKYSISVLAPRGFPRLLASPTPSGSSTSVKTAPKPRDRCWENPVEAGHEEQSFGDVAAYRGEQAQRAEGAEGGAVGRIVEEPCKAVLGSARWGSLRKAHPRCGELAAAGVQEHVERRYRGCSSVHTTAAVPVDLAATACERPWVIGVVGVAQSSAELIDRALNRVCGWPRCLEYSRRRIFCLAPPQFGKLGLAPLPTASQRRLRVLKAYASSWSNDPFYIL